MKSYDCYYIEVINACAYQNVQVHTDNLLTRCVGRGGRVSVQGVDSTDREQGGPLKNKKDRRPIFFQYGLEQA